MMNKASRVFAGRQWTGRVAFASAEFQPVRWGVEVQFARPVQLAAFDLVLYNLATLEELELQIWRRPGPTPPLGWLARSRRRSSNGSADTPGGFRISARRFPITLLCDGPVPNIPARVRFPITDTPQALAGETWTFEVSAFANGKEALLSAGVVDPVAFAAESPGFYGDASISRQPLGRDFDLAWALFETGPGDHAHFASPYRISGRDHAPILRQSHTVAVPALVLERYGGPLVSPAQDMLIPVPDSRPVTQEVALSSGGETRTLFRNFAGLTLSGDANAVQFDEERGVIRGNGLDTGTTLALEYTGHDCRYDLLSLNVRTGQLELTLGGSRARDPEEYAAKAPAETIPAFALYTTHRDVELIPLNAGGSLVAGGTEARHAAWLEDCRSRLPNTFKKLRRGEAVLLAGYGDSITALGGREPSQNLVPDGPMRDRMGYFECYEKDWKAGVPKFDNNDGAGAVHHRLGWNWILKNTFEANWGVESTYQNWGIAGTTSESNSRVMEGVEYFNGSHPLRLDALLATRPDIVVVAFGMNDIGGAVDTQANIRNICQTIRAGGSEALVVAPCRQNAGFGSRDPSLWRWTHDAVIQGAMEAGAAWCATIPIMGDGNEGVLGLSQRSHSAATMGNHPGARELNGVGRYLSLLFN